MNPPINREYFTKATIWMYIGATSVSNNWGLLKKTARKRYIQHRELLLDMMQEGAIGWSERRDLHAELNKDVVLDPNSWLKGWGPV